MNTKKNNNRSFGILFFFVFIIIGLWPLNKIYEVNIFFLFLAFVFLLLGLFNSSLLTPFNKSWIKLGEILGKIVAPIVMLTVYFIVLTPVSLIVRIFGKDMLGLKFSKKAKTYWIKKKKTWEQWRNNFKCLNL